MIKKILKVLVLVLIAAFVILQFFRIDKTNLPIVEAETLESAMPVPENVGAILNRSCNDCHSHKTVYPWYSNIQPSAWFLKDHVEHGKSHLNFSIFNTYAPKKKAKKLEEICEQVDTAEMPLPSYLWIHRGSVLREGDAKTLCDWAKTEMTKFESQ